MTAKDEVSGARLNSGTVRDGLVRVDALAELLAVEEVLQHCLHLGDARAAAHQHDVVHRALVDLGVLRMSRTHLGVRVASAQFEGSHSAALPRTAGTA